MRRLRLVVSTELSEKKKIQAIGSLAAPVRSLVFPREQGRRGLYAVRRRLGTINCKTDGICRQQGRSTNINC